MCLLAFAVRPRPGVRFVLAANRDEAFARPTRAAHAWEDAPHVLGGRDLQAGGTWLGVAKGGRVAAVTNVRDPRARREGASRGGIPRGFLEGTASAEAYCAAISREAHAYPAFNAIFADASGCFYVADDEPAPRALSDGVHAVSNGRLGDPWPKVERSRKVLSSLVHAPDLDVEALFACLRDAVPAKDEELPSTGVPIEIERILSPPFVLGDAYGTRCSTVVIVDDGGTIHFEERSFGPGGRALGTVKVAQGSV